VQRSYDIGHHQDGPSRPQEDYARLDKVVQGPPSVPGPNNDEIRRPCLSGNEVGWQFEGSAPLDLLEMLALSAELPAHFIETCCHRPIVLLRRLAIDGDASRSENGPQGQARDANECCLEADGEIKRELDSLFAVPLDVEVDHHGRKGHHLLPVSCDQTQPRASLLAAP
jgi:hypothetical protein